jgi:hypothetical protein
MAAEVQSSPPPQPDLDLEAGPKDLPADKNDPRVQASAASGLPNTTCSESQVDPATGSLPDNIQRWKPRRVHRWKSQLLMLTSFFAGLGMSIGHCVFYAKLNGVMVGKSYTQERNLRQAVSQPPTSLIL